MILDLKFVVDILIMLILVFVLFNLILISIHLVKNLKSKINKKEIKKDQTTRIQQIIKIMQDNGSLSRKELLYETGKIGIYQGTVYKVMRQYADIFIFNEVTKKFTLKSSTSNSKVKNTGKQIEKITVRERIIDFVKKNEEVTRKRVLEFADDEKISRQRVYQILRDRKCFKFDKETNKVSLNKKYILVNGKNVLVKNI